MKLLKDRVRKVPPGISCTDCIKYANTSNSKQITKCLHIKLCWWHSGQEWTLYRLHSLPEWPESHVRILVQTWLQIRTPTIQFTYIQKKVEKIKYKNLELRLYTLSNIEWKLVKETFPELFNSTNTKSMNWIILSERSDDYLLHAYQKRLSSGIQTLSKKQRMIQRILCTLHNLNKEWLILSLLRM